MRPPDTPDAPDADLALRISVERDYEEVVGAILMDSLGPFAQEPEEGATSTLVFYPEAAAGLSDEELLAPLGAELKASSSPRIERRVVPRDWVDGWKDHFHPVVIGGVRVRPPWVPGPGDTVRGRKRRGGLRRRGWRRYHEGRTRRGGRPRRDSRRRRKEFQGEVPSVDVVINPGSGFGTGLHPTTRGTLQLLQVGMRAEEGIGGSLGRLTDVGTGSGILAIAAAKMGWGPVIAFDIDPAAVSSARENVFANRVAHRVRVWEAGVEEAEAGWFEEATVLANMTLEPELELLGRLALGGDSPGGRGIASGTSKIGLPRRLVVAGILAGAQEDKVVSTARQYGFMPGGRLYEAEWVSMELFPVGPEVPAGVKGFGGMNELRKRV